MCLPLLPVLIKKDNSGIGICGPGFIIDRKNKIPADEESDDALIIFKEYAKHNWEHKNWFSRSSSRSYFLA